MFKFTASSVLCHRFNNLVFDSVQDQRGRPCVPVYYRGPKWEVSDNSAHV